MASVGTLWFARYIQYICLHICDQTHNSEPYSLLWIRSVHQSWAHPGFLLHTEPNEEHENDAAQTALTFSGNLSFVTSIKFTYCLFLKHTRQRVIGAPVDSGAGVTWVKKKARDWTERVVWATYGPCSSVYYSRFQLSMRGTQRGRRQTQAWKQMGLRQKSMLIIGNFLLFLLLLHGVFLHLDLLI